MHTSSLQYSMPPYIALDFFSQNVVNALVGIFKCLQKNSAESGSGGVQSANNPRKGCRQAHSNQTAPNHAIPDMQTK